MRGTSSPGHANNSSEIVTDIRSCHSILNYDLQRVHRCASNVFRILHDHYFYYYLDFPSMEEMQASLAWLGLFVRVGSSTDLTVRRVLIPFFWHFRYLEFY